MLYDFRSYRDVGNDWLYFFITLSLWGFQMEIKIINDLDHFKIMEYFRKKDFKFLKAFEEELIKGLGKEKCLLQSDLHKYKEKELIEFPFKIPNELNQGGKINGIK